MKISVWGENFWFLAGSKILGSGENFGLGRKFLVWGLGENFGLGQNFWVGVNILGWVQNFGFG